MSYQIIQEEGVIELLIIDEEQEMQDFHDAISQDDICPICLEGLAGNGPVVILTQLRNLRQILSFCVHLVNLPT